ncbi:MAG: DUF4331 family protein [Oceanococcaceae bacterium]
MLKTAAAMALGCMTGVAMAADHFDAPFTNGVFPGNSQFATDPAVINTLEKALDIADVFAFPDPAVPGNVVFIMTVFPLANADSRLDPRVIYQFKFDSDGDNVEEQVIQVTATGTGANQTVATSGVINVMDGATNFGLGLDNNTAAPSVLSGVPFDQVGGNAGISLYAGLSDDPFFFAFDQFSAITAAVARGDEVPGFFPVEITESRPDQDFLSELNILSIVVSVPADDLSTDASGNVAFWAATHTEVDPQSLNP